MIASTNIRLIKQPDHRAIKNSIVRKLPKRLSFRLPLAGEPQLAWKRPRKIDPHLCFRRDLPCEFPGKIPLGIDGILYSCHYARDCCINYAAVLLCIVGRRPTSQHTADLFFVQLHVRNRCGTRESITTAAKHARVVYIGGRSCAIMARKNFIGEACS